MTQQQDALAVAQNGGVQDDSDLDIDGDDLDDDDMSGGISSSPSIEDGMCPVRDPSPCWPRRVLSLRGVTPSLNTHGASEAMAPALSVVSFAATARSSVGATELAPLHRAPQLDHHHHHHRDALFGNDLIETTDLTCATFEAGTDVPTKHGPHDNTHGTTEHRFLEEREELGRDKHGDAAGCDELLIAYDPASDDDDDDGSSDLSLPDDPRYVDSS